MGFWGWFTLITGIIGVVAFLMAVSPFAQMIWGRPKIKIVFGIEVRDNISFLRCEIWNEPIRKGFLKNIGVRRDTANDVVAFLCIKEDDGEIILPMEYAVKVKTQ